MARGMRIAPGEFYHIFNRGVSNNNIFLDARDYARFIFLILYFQSEMTVFNPGYSVTSFLKTGKFGISDKKVKEILQNRSVGLIAFTPMPNHFHLILKEHTEGGISKYMHKVSMAYSKYFNAKYKKSGHVFQGTYRVVYIEDNDQLLYTSAYVHKNSKELKDWARRPEQYPWSSYQDYMGANRWGDLLAQDIILGQFETKKEYFDWVKETTAKENFEDLDLLDT